MNKAPFRSYYHSLNAESDGGVEFKANSIEGNKKDNINIIYTPWANLKKTGAMAVGEVSFHDSREVRNPLSMVEPGRR